MSWNDCRMDAAALLCFSSQLPAPLCLLFCLWLVQCDGWTRQSPSHLGLAHLFSSRFLKLGMELFAIPFGGPVCFLSGLFQKVLSLMIKIKKFRCFCLVSGTQPAICLECTHALRHRTEVLVAHSGRGHTNIASWGTPVFWPRGGCAPNCVKKVELHKTLFFVSLSSYRNLLGPPKFWVNEKNKKNPLLPPPKECKAKAYYCLSGTK